jgi:hypothetical protein
VSTLFLPIKAQVNSDIGCGRALAELLIMSVRDLFFY